MVLYKKPKTRSSRSHLERQKITNEAHNKNIVEVAQSLGMILERTGKDYQWKEHDSFKIDTRKNYFYWNSRGIGGDSIKLVQLMMECSFKEAINFMTGHEFKTFDKSLIPKLEFSYKLKEAANPSSMRDYLKNQRQLSDETINFFIVQGILAQANYKDIGSESNEPMVVFKHFDSNNKIQGMALQGIKDNFELYPERGKLKKTFGDGLYGCVAKVGNPPIIEEKKINNEDSIVSEQNPLKVIVFEAPIDMMSYIMNSIKIK